MGIKKGLKPRLAEVGKIKIGGKGEERKGSKGMYRLPVRYDNFVVTTTEKDLKTGNFKPDEELMKKLGEKPTEIRVVFLFDDIDMNFNTSFAFYQGAKCICRGDGESADRLFTQAGKPSQFTITDNADGKTKEGERHKIICDPDICPMMQPDKNGATKCKPSGILSCLIPESMNIGGVYRFRTHSWNTISNILASLELIQTITGGVLVGLPMKLQLLKKATEAHGNVNTVNVVFDGQTQKEMRELAFVEMKNRTDHGVNMAQIETRAKQAGFLEDTDDPKDVEEEFYNTAPDEEKKAPPKNITDRAESVLGNVKTENIEDAETEIIIEDKSKPEREPEPEEVPEEIKPEKKKAIGKPLDSPEVKSIESLVDNKTGHSIDEEENIQDEEDDGLEIF